MSKYSSYTRDDLVDEIFALEEKVKSLELMTTDRVNELVDERLQRIDPFWYRVRAACHLAVTLMAGVFLVSLLVAVF